VFTGMMIVLQLLFGSSLYIFVDRWPQDVRHDDGVFVPFGSNQIQDIAQAL